MTHPTTMREALLAVDPTVLTDCRVNFWKTWDPEDISHDSISCAALRPASEEDATLIGLDYLSGGDYNGGALVRSNVAVVQAMVEASPYLGGIMVDYDGDLGTYGLAFRLDAPVLEEGARDLAGLAERLVGLLEYPCADEEHYSLTESEDESEAWESYGREEFAAVLALQVNDPVQGTEVNDGPLVSLHELFHVVADAENVGGGAGVQHTEGEGVIFYVDRVAEHIRPVLLFALGMVKLDPDYLLDLAADTDPDAGDEARRLRRLVGLGVALRSLHRNLMARGMGDRLAWDTIIRGEIDAGDCATGLSADLPRAQLTATIRLFWGYTAEGRYVEGTAAVTLDPTVPWLIDAAELALLFEPIEGD